MFSDGEEHHVIRDLLDRLLMVSESVRSCDFGVAPEENICGDVPDEDILLKFRRMIRLLLGRETDVARPQVISLLGGSREPCDRLSSLKAARVISRFNLLRQYRLLD